MTRSRPAIGITIDFSRQDREQFALRDDYVRAVEDAGGLPLVLAPGRYGAILLSACACSVVAFLLAIHLRKGYVLALEKNLGFGEGNNIDVQRAQGDVIVLLNNDMRVERDFLAPLLSPFDDTPDLFAATPRIVNRTFGGDEAGDHALSRTHKQTEYQGLPRL